MLKGNWFALFLVAAILSGCSEKEEAQTIEETEIESIEVKETVTEKEEMVEKEESVPEEQVTSKQEPVEEQSEPSETEKTEVEETAKNVSYTNEKLGFSLTIPPHWEKVLTIDEDKSWDNDLEHAVNFYYQPNSNIKSAVFSIVVYDEEKNPDEWYHPFGKLIEVRDGKTFGYVMPGEPAAELFEPGNEDMLDFVIMMMNDDVPAVIQSIHF